MGSAVRSTKHGIRLANGAHQFHRVSLDFFSLCEITKTKIYFVFGSLEFYIAPTFPTRLIIEFLNQVKNKL